MSSGAKSMEQVYRHCLESTTPLRFVVVMGRQADVISVLEAVPVDPKHSVKFIGFCKQMPELLRAADLMVGKSGGLTVAENAALGVPLIVLDPIPGQEQRNADILLEIGAALKVNDLPLLPTKIDAVFANASKLGAMKTAIEGLGRANSAFTVADTVIADYEKSRKK